MFELLGEQLRARREEMHLTQAVVADRAGVGRTHYVQTEAGETNPSLGFLVKVMRVLGINSIQVENFGIHATTPDLTALIRAQEGVRKARALLARHGLEITDDVAELDDIGASISKVIATGMPADPIVTDAARELARVAKDRAGAGRAIRDVAQSERVERQKRPAAAQKSSRSAGRAK